MASINNVFKDFEAGRKGDGRIGALNDQRVLYQIPNPQDYPGFETHPTWIGGNHFANETEAIAWLESEARAQVAH